MDKNSQPNTTPQERPRTYEAAVSFDEFKKAIGPEAIKYTDEQIDQMRLMCDQIANAFFDTWLVEQNRA